MPGPALTHSLTAKTHASDRPYRATHIIRLRANSCDREYVVVDSSSKDSASWNCVVLAEEGVSMQEKQGVNRRERVKGWHSSMAPTCGGKGCDSCQLPQRAACTNCRA